MSRISQVEEVTAVGFQDKNPDKDMMAALTGEEGPMGAGMIPRLGNMSDAGEKALAESLTGDSWKEKDTQKKQD